jgi:hypothetical protein
MAGAQHGEDIDNLIAKHNAAISQLHVAMDFAVELAARYEAENEKTKVRCAEHHSSHSLSFPLFPSPISTFKYHFPLTSYFCCFLCDLRSL